MGRTESSLLGFVEVVIHIAVESQLADLSEGIIFVRPNLETETETD